MSQLFADSTFKRKAVPDLFIQNQLTSKPTCRTIEYIGQRNVLYSMVRPAVQKITVVTQPKEVCLHNSARDSLFTQACSLGRPSVH